MPWKSSASLARISHSSGWSGGGHDRRRVVRDVAHRELEQRDVVVGLLQRVGRRQDHVGVARRLVDVDVDRDHELERRERGVEPSAAVRRRDHRIAGDGHERADLPLARVSRSPRPWRPRAARPASRGGRAPGSCAGRCAARARPRLAAGVADPVAGVVNIAPPGPVEVAGAHVQHVDQPARERAELLRRACRCGRRRMPSARPRARARGAGSWRRRCRSPAQRPRG